MFLFKRKSKSKDNSSTKKEENAPVIQYDLLFSKDGIGVKEKGVFLYLYPHKTEPNRTVYELMSCYNDMDSSEDSRAFMGAVLETMERLCGDYKTAVLIYNSTANPLEEEVLKYMESHVDLDSDIFVAYPYGMLEVKRGLDDRLRAAFQEDRGDRVYDSGYFSCFAMRDDFFESCPAELFDLSCPKDFKTFFSSLIRFRTVATCYCMDCFHNEATIEVDDTFIPEDKVLTILRDCCEKYDRSLYKSKNL